MTEIEIKHYKCSICKKNITYEEDNEIRHNTFFDIRRSNCGFEMDNDKCVFLDEENVKMNIYVCKECFDKILNESKTLGDYFWIKGEGFIY